ncbi:unnamed protein product [Urochloa humidicola]
MSSSQTFPWQTKQEADAEVETNPELYQHFANLIPSFPASEGMSHDLLYRHDQGWHAAMANMVGAMVADSCFTARPTDIIVASLPKSGTTWIKALLFATVHRDEYPADADDHPLHSFNPHECIGFFEFRLYLGMDPLTVECAAELFCDGLSPFGPYWDHVLGYWRAHLAHPGKVLFFTYEEMQRDPEAHIRRLAEFIGLPFSAKEEEDGVVAAIVRLCSFEHMSELKVTKYGLMATKDGPIENSLFYRCGVVGDWANHLSLEAAQRIDAITEARFKDSGLNVA